jgi:hypothetical protein
MIMKLGRKRLTVSPLSDFPISQFCGLMVVIAVLGAGMYVVIKYLVL